MLFLVRTATTDVICGGLVAAVCRLMILVLVLGGVQHARIVVGEQLLQLADVADGGPQGGHLQLIFQIRIPSPAV
jgi:hypothetical protein